MVRENTGLLNFNVMRKIFIYILLLTTSLSFGQHEMMLLASHAQFKNETPPSGYQIVARVNCGGGAITATDGEIDWESNLLQTETGNNYETDGIDGFIYDSSSVTFVRHSSIPVELPDTDFQAIFDNGRSSDFPYYYKFLDFPAGDYKVRIYIGESEGHSVSPYIPFGIKINNITVASDIDVSALYGAYGAGMMEFDITSLGGDITLETINPSNTWAWMEAVELLKKN